MAAGPNELTSILQHQNRAAVIFGSHIFLGVCNKFCAVCAVAANKGIDAPQHICYDATTTGQATQQPWKATSLHKDSTCLNRCTNSGICLSMVTVIVR